MQPDWNYVKKTTLWQYGDLIKKLNVVTAYPVLWGAYNHNMAQAADFARCLFPDNKVESGDSPAGIIHSIKQLQAGGIQDWGDLLSRVATQDDCLAFLMETGLKFEDFINVLNYLLRWGFPFQTSTRELLEHENPQEMASYEILKRNKLMISFDILERGCKKASRRALAKLTGLPLEFVHRLVHRADIARLPYVRRKTILILCGAGYDSLAKIAAADLSHMESDLEDYFQRAQGKPWKNYKAVILPKGLVTGARALPVIVEG